MFAEPAAGFEAAFLAAGFFAGAAGVAVGAGGVSSANAGRETRTDKTKIARVRFMEISSRRRPRRRESLV
jgi:hypothetical protein